MNFYSKFTFVLLLFLSYTIVAETKYNITNFANYDICDDLTNGGLISGNESGCANPTFDPSLIVNLFLPTGGSGDIEYIWIFTTDDPTGSATWTPIPDTNSPEYDPTEISVTTHYRRCARRSGCDEYLTEANYVTKTVDCSTGQIGDFVWIDYTPDGIQGTEEPGIHNISVILTGTDINGNDVLLTTTTDIDGHYLFDNLLSGDYKVSFILGTDMVFSPQNTTDDDLDSDVNINTGMTSIFSLSPGESNLTIDAGMYSSCSPLLNGGLIGTNATNCGPLGAMTITNLSTPDGGSGIIDYLWYISYTNDPFSTTSGNWFLIDGENNETLNIGTTTQNTYYVRISKSDDCTMFSGTSNIVSLIIYDGIEIESEITNETCAGSEDGIININVTNGTAPFDFEWDPPQSNNATITNLAEGWYYLTVTDANDCSLETLLDILSAPSLQLTTSVTNNNCFNAENGTASVFVISDTGPYTYLWDINTGNQVTATAIDLASGTYTVIVTDSNLCSNTAEVTITSPTEINIASSTIDAGCNLNTGSIETNVSGGTPDYTYLWSNFSTNPNISGLTAGDYFLTVTDMNGCTKEQSFTVNDTPNLSINVTGTNILCYDDNDGTANITIIGGSGPFNYEWSNTIQTTSTITGLSANTYNVTVTDNNDCFATGSYTVTGPSSALDVNEASIIHASCGEFNGSISLDVTGGTGNYTYIWSNFETTSTITLLEGGVNYGVTITDENGCTYNGNYMVANLGDLEIETVLTHITCNGQEDGTGTVNVINGSGPYTYQWDANTGNQVSATATNLAPGTYSVTVEDDNNCSVIGSVTITEEAELTCSASITSDYNGTHLSTIGSCDASAEVIGFGGTGPYTYLWSNLATTNTVDNLCSGSYTVTITDDNDCMCVSQVIVLEPCIVQGFVWHDTEENDIQNANEDPIANVEIILTGTDIYGSIVNLTTTTNSLGEYIFEPLIPGNYTVNTETSLTDLVMVAMDIGSNDLIDSDFNTSTGNTISFNILSGEILVFDAGYKAEPLNNYISIGDFVWFDVNQNGIQELSDPGRNNVTVTLYETGADLIAGTSDDLFVGDQLTHSLPGVSDGYYLFDNIPIGNYYIIINEDDLPNGGIPGNTSATQQDAGTNDNLDSDINEFYVSNIVNVTLSSGNILHLDAGYQWDCNPIQDGGEIEADETLCGSLVDPAPITNVQAASGGYGPVEYIWMYSTNVNSSDPTTYILIPGETGDSYDPGPITETTKYVRCARNFGCTTYLGESNFIIKTVKPMPDAIINGTTDMCLFETASFSADYVDGATYFWDFGINSTPESSIEISPSGITYSTIAFKQIELEVTLDGCINTAIHYLNVQSCGLQVPEITNFKVSSDQKTNISLTWDVEEEFDQTVFLIERSRDNDIFKVIGQIEGQGNNALNSYRFVEDSPRKGENFYRIKQYSFAIEDYNYSNTLMLEYLPVGSIKSMVFPNPFLETTKFEIFDDVETELNIQIVDIYGKTIETKIFKEGTKTGELDLYHYPDGVYFLYFTYNKFRKSTQKIVKLK